MITWDVVRHRVAIAGRVTDAETGEPMRGARVAITSAPDEFDDWLALHARQFEDRWEAMSERADRARTAADGHFHFMDLPLGRYELEASLPGSGSRYGTATTRVRVRLRGGEPAMSTADLTLPPTTVKGSVTRRGRDKEVMMAEVRIAGSGERTFSDREGRYSLSGIEAGRRTVRVSARGYREPTPRTVDLSAAGEVVDLDFALRPAAS